MDRYRFENILHIFDLLSVLSAIHWDRYAIISMIFFTCRSIIVV